MPHRSLFFTLVVCVVLLLGLNLWLLNRSAVELPVRHHEDEPELALYMADLQRYTHKLVLAVHAENAPLAGFYLHEVEEVAETVAEEIPMYEGHAIADLTEALLVPAIETLETHIAANDWTATRQQLALLVNACNQCHIATDHGFIQIAPEAEQNPFLQVF